MLEIGMSLVSFGTEYLVFQFAIQNYKHAALAVPVVLSQINVKSITGLEKLFGIQEFEAPKISRRSAL